MKTHLPLQLARDAARREEEEEGSNGIISTRFGVNGPSALRRGRRGEQRGDGMFQLMAELVVVMVEVEAH